MSSGAFLTVLVTISIIAAISVTLAVLSFSHLVRALKTIRKSDEEERWEWLAKEIVTEFLPQGLEGPTERYLDGDLPREDYGALLSTYRQLNGGEAKLTEKDGLDE